jgi:hypothetical protein
MLALRLGDATPMLQIANEAGMLAAPLACSAITHKACGIPSSWARSDHQHRGTDADRQRDDDRARRGPCVTVVGWVVMTKAASRGLMVTTVQANNLL